MLIDNIKSIVLSWRWSWVFIYFLLIASFFILGCESPTAPYEKRSDDTTIIRNDSGRK